MTDIICGVDIGSKTLDARIGKDGAQAWFARSAQGIAELAAFGRSHGGYERLPFGLLWAEGLPCALLNPRMVRRFAEAMGTLEKTDRLDAGLIAWCAAVKRIGPQPPARKVQGKLAALVTRLSQLTALRVAQANQRRLVDDPDVLASIDEVIALVMQQSRGLEDAILALIQADPLWRRLDQAFRQIKGVANRTVARLMAELPEIGTFNSKAIAKLAGLAPIARDSGLSCGRRSIRGGRAGVRSILVIVAEVVRRHDPDFAAFHAKLTQAGKPKMAIRVALARKLLVRLNAKARDARATLAQTA